MAGKTKEIFAPNEISLVLSELEGLLVGMNLDGKVTKGEIKDLNLWMKSNKKYRHVSIVKEVLKNIETALEDGKIDQEEIQDLIWTCNRLKGSNLFLDTVMSDLSVLKGLLQGILADNKITDDELKSLEKWILARENLTGMYPYDELFSLLVAILDDGKIDKDELILLKTFLTEFSGLERKTNINVSENLSLRDMFNISGICVMDPQIEFSEKVFTYAGLHNRGQKKKIRETVEVKGGKFTDLLDDGVSYLIVSCGENPYWCFSAYGRKVEMAQEMRSKGKDIQIVNEVDFWDVVGD